MSWRTSSSLVKGVLLGDYDQSSCPSLKPFIDAANALVDEVRSKALAKGLSPSPTMLANVETWLAAHFYATSDRPAQERYNLRARDVYQGRTGTGLDATYYGQTAKTLDTTGILQGITSPGKRVKIAWLGTREREALDYGERND